MGKAEQMIKMYRNLSLGCAAVASGLLIVAVVLFAVFRIPEIWKRGYLKNRRLHIPGWNCRRKKGNTRLGFLFRRKHAIPVQL